MTGSQPGPGSGPGRSAAVGLTAAFGLFSIAPVPPAGELTRRDAAAALRWFPVVGALLAAAAALPAAAIAHWASRGVGIGAVLAVALLAVFTRGLHLDGLADTADGLGSRAPAQRALEIMKRSDIGPFGVLSLILVLLADVLAMATLPGSWAPVVAFAVAATTGRVASLAAAHRTVPSARSGGFGALVTGSVSSRLLVLWAALALAGGGLLAWSVGESVPGWIVAQLLALGLGAAFLAHVRHRIGGVTGDVFGALVELVTALTLAGFVLAG